MAQGTKMIVVDKADSFQKSFAEPNMSHCLLFFWADWHEPCKQLTPVLEQLSLDHPHLSIFSINAEEYSDISESFNITSVPTVIFCKNSKETRRLEAAVAPDLVSAVSVFSKQAATYQKLVPNNGDNKEQSSNADNSNTNDQNQNKDKEKDKTKNNDENENKSNDKNQDAEAAAKEAQEKLNKRLARLIKAAPIMLFMKGSPQEPRCKFSRAVIEIFKEQKIGKFGYFDILGDNDVRQGLKTYSNWKTYPQLYINGKLIGGLDIIKEMIEEGEFEDALPKAESEKDLNARLAKLIATKPIMLFMKGTPDSPQCGFSNRMVKLLRDNNVNDFGHFNILEDMDVRQGLKKYSNWPTYPQLYINNKLIGGLDIVQEMIEEGEFQDALPN